MRSFGNRTRPAESDIWGLLACLLCFPVLALAVCGLFLTVRDPRDVLLLSPLDMVGRILAAIGVVTAGLAVYLATLDRRRVAVALSVALGIGSGWAFWWLGN